MWAHKAIRIVEDQFIQINNEVRKMEGFFSLPGGETKMSFRDEILKLHNSVFDLLIGGEELPIYLHNLFYTTNFTRHNISHLFYLSFKILIL